MAELVPDAFSAGRAGRAGADETDRRAGSPATESPTTVRVLDALSNRTPRTVQQLAANSGLAPDRVRAELGLLELDGCVTERPDGWVRRARADGR